MPDSNIALPLVRFVVAYAANRVIGKDNDLPWKLPSDLAHFKRTTMGQPILMGRRTWESLGRPLPGRRNLVITRQADYQATGAEIFPTLDAALQACTEQESICVIGGAEIFKAALPLADEIVATEIHAEPDGDVFFPALNPAEWKEVSREPQPEENGLSFDFVVYQRAR